ncbi:class I SAM-dependent methyltransferase [Plastoroseomonas hellenica]|uniref:class I SAM-dependent methyltransferase n=1 Tax=Plastoroseomonas hellenica TaxID=2687306 RepID=UPI001BA9F68F|nr:class I SAM-dependent methyltransferase [Plastoroseomonas hellenica]MBR0647512.1 class I SAM-dependent methyltransferase [Plastoroseomonas hellenica]
MSVDVHGPYGFAQFYARPTGRLAGRLLRERLAALWPDLSGQAVLGIGHAAPYLGLWRGQARCCLSLAPAQLAPPATWPLAGPCATLVAEEERLPFPDLAFDRVLLVHGLEAADNARRLLREAWRVLKDDGRLLVVVPNRRGLWAHNESTPFGHGQPYSPGQLGRLLARHLFRVERRDSALFFPPFRARPLLRTARLWEAAGHALWPARFAGVAIAEAEKDVFAALPAGTVAVRRRVVRSTEAAYSFRPGASSKAGRQSAHIAQNTAPPHSA